MTLRQGGRNSRSLTVVLLALRHGERIARNEQKTVCHRKFLDAPHGGHEAVGIGIAHNNVNPWNRDTEGSMHDQTTVRNFNVLQFVFFVFTVLCDHKWGGKISPQVFFDLTFSATWKNGNRSRFFRSICTSPFLARVAWIERSHSHLSIGAFLIKNGDP